MRGAVEKCAAARLTRSSTEAYINVRYTSEFASNAVDVCFITAP